MTVYAYLRVSSVSQDEQNQRQGVDAKAVALNVQIDKYIVDKVSGTKEPKLRNLGSLARRLKSGDVVIVSELSCLSRRIFTLCRLFEDLLEKGVRVYSVKENFVLDDSPQSKMLYFRPVILPLQRFQIVIGFNEMKGVQ
jgi:DNA invertase Pin-like site-specific DNA recombinase